MAARIRARSEMTDDPIALFADWFREAEEAGVDVPETMTLATADSDGAPSARMVLMKGADEDGFLFYSGYVSRKAGELERNPRAALVFYWRPLGRQVRVEGRVVGHFGARTNSRRHPDSSSSRTSSTPACQMRSMSSSGRW